MLIDSATLCLDPYKLFLYCMAIEFEGGCLIVLISCLYLCYRLFDIQCEQRLSSIQFLFLRLLGANTIIEQFKIVSIFHFLFEIWKDKII